MLASLTMCGHIELKPTQASMGSLFQMLGFSLPQPSNRGKADNKFHSISTRTSNKRSNRFFTNGGSFSICLLFQVVAFVISRLLQYCNQYSLSRIHRCYVARFSTRYPAYITATMPITLYSRVKIHFRNSQKRYI